MKRLILYIIILLTSIVTARASQLTQQADSAYNQEDYRQAIRLYQQAIDTEGVNTDIYYNLGNAYYRIGQIGKAVANYHRALNLDPSNKDARENLAFVNTKILDKPEDDSTFLTNLHNSIASIMSPDQWAAATMALFVLLTVCVAMYVFSGYVTLRKVGFFGGIIVIIVMVYTLVVSIQTAQAFSNSNKAVIIVPTANLRTMPGNTSSDENKIITLHEGTVLEITDSMSIPGQNISPTWYDVKINNSTRAWVNSSDVEKI